MRNLSFSGYDSCYSSFDCSNDCSTHSFCLDQSDSILRIIAYEEATVIAISFHFDNFLLIELFFHPILACKRNILLSSTKILLKSGLKDEIHELEIPQCCS